jgi:hypothetical protein
LPWMMPTMCSLKCPQGNNLSWISIVSFHLGPNWSDSYADMLFILLQINLLQSCWNLRGTCRAVKTWELYFACSVY